MSRKPKANRRAPRLLIAALSLAGLLACSEGLGPVPFQGVSGTISFIGEPPDSTEWVRLAVYRVLPVSTLDLLGFAAFSDTLSLAESSVSYTLPLEAGTYAWLPVVWKRRDVPLGLEALRVIGWYSDSGPFGPPASFTIEPNAAIAGIEITADFGTLLTPAQALEAIR